MKDVGKKYHCTCEPPTDYELQEDGKTCVKIHPCDKKNKGGCAQICNKKPFDEEEEEEEEEESKPFTCSCKPGFKLDEDGVTCNKIHPCDTPKKGGCEQVCVKKGDDAECKCNTGFLLTEDGKKCEPG